MKNLAKSLFGLILYIVLIFGTAYLLGHFVVGQVEVDGPSMNDTLQDHDRVLMNKFTYRVKTLDRFDVIVFKYAYDTDTDYIKRVIGLPGETVEIRDGRTWIDAALLEEPYVFSSQEDYSIALGEDEYLVLGDNRAESYDSRASDMGPVSGRDLLGRVRFRIWPPGSAQ